MENPTNHSMFERGSIFRSKTPAVKWFKEWVPQDVVTAGGKCSLLKWVSEDVLNALREKAEEEEAFDPEPEPTTEVLFLCSYDGCGKTFVDAGALRKHAHIHGERQYICHYEGCGKKFLDSSKLKRHFLIHTGERDFICPHEGCGKAFSLDFNLRSHMKTHSQENYHVCLYPDCGKRYAHEYKLKNHVLSHHERSVDEGTRYTPTPPAKLPKPLPKPSSERPYVCPYGGCGKAYIHEYKLNLHLRREHPTHFVDENAPDADQGSDPDHAAWPRPNGKSAKPVRQRPKIKMPRAAPPMRTALEAAGTLQVGMSMPPEEAYRDDSEETEENGDDRRWSFMDLIHADTDNDDDDNDDGDGGLHEQHHDGSHHEDNDDDDDDDDDDEETEYED